MKLRPDGGNVVLAAAIAKRVWVDLDDLGDEGWQLVAFVPNRGFFQDKVKQLAVFKREVGDPRAAQPVPSDTYRAQKIGRACA
jgi:hypothetical protein